MELAEDLIAKAEVEALENVLPSTVAKKLFYPFLICYRKAIAKPFGKKQ